MTSYSLSEISDVLDVPQHRLIHFCEKGVVRPDIAQAGGRGSQRLFSKRNAFEFAVALEMRRLELPVTFIAAVLQVLATFERSVRKKHPAFSLPDSILEPGRPRVSVAVIDGQHLYFQLERDRGATVILGGVVLEQMPRRGRAGERRTTGKLHPVTADEVARPSRTRVEIDLTQIAQALSPLLSDNR